MTVAPKPTLSVSLRTFDENPSTWQPLFEFADAADRAGIDRVVAAEHVLYGENLEAYADPATGGSLGGKQPTGPDGHWLDPLTVLTMIAARTTHVRLATGILLAALRPAPLLAKQLATLDVLSGGRVDLGVGIGWQREEYDACGVDFSRRGALLDERLGLLQRLWTETVVDHDDGVFRLERIHAMPKPAQPGGVPIWVSGRITDRTVRRVVAYGTGWIPWGDHIADPAPGIATMREALDAAGRDPSQLLVQGTLPVVKAGDAIDLAATMDGVGALREAGITDFRFNSRWTGDGAQDHDTMAAVVTALRATAENRTGTSSSP